LRATISAYTIIALCFFLGGRAYPGLRRFRRAVLVCERQNVFRPCGGQPHVGSAFSRYAQRRAPAAT
jgi:hypothetical protein